MENKARRVIKGLIDSGKKDFVIYPYGKRGREVEKLLEEEFGIIDVMVVDNYASSENKRIIKVDELRQDDLGNKWLLLCSDSREKMVEIRRELFEKITTESYTDVFSNSLYFDPDSFYDSPSYDYYDFTGRRLIALEAVMRELYRNNVQGAVAECGVYKGEFANYISAMFPERRMYLFDTFEGFDDRDLGKKEDDGETEKYEQWREEFPLNDSSVELVLSNISYVKNATVIKGWFPESVKDTAACDETYAFVSLDTDLYQPIKAGLDFFYPRLSPGGVIFVHDYVSEPLPGVERAVREFCYTYHVAYTRLGDNYSAMVLKPY